MNRRHGQSQGQSQRNFGSQSSRGNRDFDYESSRGQQGQQRMSSSQDDSFETGRGYRDTDYDLDGSTYGSNSSLFGSNRASTGGRTPMSYSSDSSYGSDYGDFDTNERTRQPRFNQMDEERMGNNRSSYDSSFGRYAGSQGDRGLNRQGSSSERFGYPSNMNAWSGNDRQFNSGRTTGRFASGSTGWSGNSSQQTTDRDFDLYGSNGSSQSYNAGYQGQSSYGEGSLGQDWGSQSSERTHFGKGPKGYKRSDDRIKEEVCETLARNPRIDASDIEVEVSDAMVTLSGTVESKEIRRAAEMAIENLSGVDDVKNEIRVKKADSQSFGSSSMSGREGGKSSKQTTSSTSGTSIKGSSSL